MNHNVQQMFLKFNEHCIRIGMYVSNSKLPHRKGYTKTTLDNVLMYMVTV